MANSVDFDVNATMLFTEIMRHNNTNDSNISPGKNMSHYVITVLISRELHLTRIVVQRFMVPIIVSLGILGNVFNIVVLRHPKMRSSTNIYLLALACCDSMYLLFSLSLSFLHCSNQEQSALAFYYIPYGRVVSDLFANTAVWLTVSFTLERYIGVCYPMKGKAWCTVGKAKIVVMITFIVSVVNTVPEIFELKIIRSNNEISEIRYECRYTEFAESQSYQIGYYWWYMTLFTFLPLVLLSIFNSLLIRSVWRANKNRQLLSNTRVLGENQKQNSEQQKVTTMLIAVVLIFILCQLPQAVLLIFKSYFKSQGIPDPADLFRIAGNICNLLVQVNSSVNFLLYSYFSSKFRRTFKKLFCNCNKVLRSNTMRSITNTYNRKSSSTTGTTLTSSSTCQSRKSGLGGANEDKLINRRKSSAIETV